MTFWTKMKRAYPAGTVGEMCEVRGGSTFDHTISECDGYEMTNGIKKLTLQNDFPVCYNRIINKQVKFNSVHFQGYNMKALIRNYKTYE